MERAFKGFMICITAIVALAINGCNVKDPQMIADQSTGIENQNWGYNNRVRTDFVIDDITITYNLYLNLRVTPDYKYSNIFVLIHQIGPDKKVETSRYEFTLADKDGEWLGQGTGNLYSYQVTYKTKYKFPAKGKYRIEVEQNMRDNPLRNVSDAGVRVEKAE